MSGATKGNKKKIVNHERPLVSTRTDTVMRRYSVHTLRAIVMDIPLFLLLALCGTAAWIGHVHENYWKPQMKAMQWTPERHVDEYTYYKRSCDERDISTQNGADLFLPEDATLEDAYQHQLKHGFTILKSVLSPNTTKNLRNHITSRNQNLTKDESLFILEAENRVTFSPSMDEPAVHQAIMELTHHEQLKALVEKVMGPDPALIEFAPITIQYGADDQNWHPDVFSHSSATRYSQSFRPCYSVFVQLQDTTEKMGATGACPGTHYCSDEEGMTELCNENGFQVVDPELGYWPAGDALLMNMNSQHRGSAHRDPEGLDRVMLVMTFAPKPQEVAESRLVSLGGTYHILWDMWGHTWSDLMNADTSMKQPWATLKALGMYKPRGTSWGIDYVTSVTMRMANEDGYFEDKDLQNLLDKGGIPYLPSFLQGHADMEDEMTYYKFLLTTFINVDGFLKVITAAVMLVYVLTLVAMSFQRKDELHHHEQKQSSALLSSILRPIAFYAFIHLIYLMACWRVDSTQWAKDIKSNRLYGPAMENEEDFIVNPPVGVTTVPNHHDVLVERRFGYAHLGMHKDYITGHPGNTVLNHLIQGVAPTYADYPEVFRDASAQYIVDAIALDHGRFLEQGLNGRWHWGDGKEAVRFTRNELVKSSSPLLNSLMEGIRYAIGGYQFGAYRKTALSRKHMAPYLRDLERKLLRTEAAAVPSVSPTTRPLARPPATTRRFKPDGVTILDWEFPVTATDEPSNFRPSTHYLPTQSTNGSNRTMRSTPSGNSFLPEEPTPGAWISTGSLVEGLFEGHWYFATVLEAAANRAYLVEYADGEEEVILDYDEIRRYTPYEDTMGEIVEIRMKVVEDENEYADPDDQPTSYVRCEVIHVDDDGLFHVILEDDGRFFEGVDIQLLRRIGELEDEEEDDDDDKEDEEE